MKKFLKSEVFPKDVQALYERHLVELETVNFP